MYISIAMNRVGIDTLWLRSSRRMRVFRWQYRSMPNIATELSILRTHAEQCHPFILGLECAFQSASKLHFVMEYVPGGMLFAHLRSHEMFSEKMARFYAAEVMMGLHHLHQLSIIYRDLKPENVLICADGNVKLCDVRCLPQSMNMPTAEPYITCVYVSLGSLPLVSPRRQHTRRHQAAQCSLELPSTWLRRFSDACNAARLWTCGRSAYCYTK